MSDNVELEVIFDSCNMAVNIGTTAELDCHAAIQFIVSGQKEIDSYVQDKIIPKLRKISGIKLGD